jgi:pimeloyl-ACP methyl ester carboxylesterase
MNTAGCILLNSDLSFVLFLRGAVLTFDYTDTPYCSCFWISASQLYSKVISFFAHSKHCLIGGASLDCWGVQAALEHLLQRTDIDPKRIFVFGRSLGGAVGSALTRRNPGKVGLDFCFQTISNISNCHCALCFGQLVTTAALN